MQLQCNKCKQNKPDNDFAFCSANKARRQRQYTCKVCANARAIEDYDKNKDRYKGHATARTAELRRKVSELKSKPCTDCGKIYPPYVMDWDHLPQFVKRYNISYMLRHRMAWKSIEAEIQKCELVCSNCHRVRTHRRTGKEDF